MSHDQQTLSGQTYKALCKERRGRQKKRWEDNIPIWTAERHPEEGRGQGKIKRTGCWIIRGTPAVDGTKG